MGRPNQASIFTCVKYEIAAFAHIVNKIDSLPDGFFSPGILARKGFVNILFTFDTRFTSEYAIRSLRWYEFVLGPQFASVLGALQDPCLSFLASVLEIHSFFLCGRLSLSLEGAGKRRIFAIGNYIKERLLYPVHQWAMDLLRSIPTDGRFNQFGPIERLLKLNLDSCFSFDLKNATDRWPLSFIYSMMVPGTDSDIIDREFHTRISHFHRTVEDGEAQICSILRVWATPTTRLLRLLGSLRSIAPFLGVDGGG